MPDEHTLVLAEMAPLIGSRLVLREEVKVDHPMVAEVTVHVRLKKTVPDDSQLGIQFRIGQVSELEAPAPPPPPAALAAPVAQVPPRAAQSVDTVITRLGATSPYTGTAVVGAGTAQGVVRGMRVLLSKHGPEHAYGRGTVVFVAPDEATVGYSLRLPEPDVAPGDAAYLRARYDGEPDAP